MQPAFLIGSSRISVNFGEYLFLRRVHVVSSVYIRAPRGRIFSAHAHLAHFTYVYAEKSGVELTKRPDNRTTIGDNFFNSTVMSSKLIHRVSVTEVSISIILLSNQRDFLQ